MLRPRCRGERPHVRVISEVVRQQTGGIYLDSGDPLLLMEEISQDPALGFWHMFPNPLNGPVRSACLQKNCHTNHLPLARLIHQVHHHVGWFAANVLFAGMVKVELP
jgi:hypothetical protein